MSKAMSEKVLAIRNEFIKSLPQRINKIRAMSNKILDQEWDPALAKDLTYEVHNLRGFSGSHGLNRISGMANKAEQIIDMIRKQDTKLSTHNKTELKIAIDSLISAMHNVHDDISNEATLITSSPNKASSESPLVMVVDDDHAFCEYLSLQLETLGYHTKYIYDVTDVEQSIHTYKPKAIFMDIIFKDSENAGTKIISDLRAKDEIPCPVIYMSAKDDLNARLSAVKSGGKAFLNKSFSLNELKNTLDLVIPLQSNANLKVLIIDDDKSMNAYCTAIFESEGIKTFCLETPENVFESIINFNPDVILLDMYMPNINGLEMAAIIRQHQSFAAIPIVIMSGETDINKQFVMRSVGADDFILKPFKPHHLIDIVLNRIKRSRQTKKMITSDSLTGLMLFPKIKDQVINLMESCIRYNLDYSIAFIDLDHFKKVNDTYGHLVGDQVLRDFSEFVSGRVRKSDIVTRYGGEEFTVILPYTNGDNAIRALNSIREEYAKKVHRAKNSEFTVTFSGGISSANQYQDLESLLSAADKALYKSKRQGGNNINLAD